MKFEAKYYNFVHEERVQVTDLNLIQKRKALVQLIFIGLGWKKYLTYLCLGLSVVSLPAILIRNGISYVFSKHATKKLYSKL